MKRLESSRGWTLTEMMIGVVITGVLATIGPPVMIQIQRFYLQSGSRSSIQRDARESINIINRFLRQAKSNTIVIDTPTNQPPYSRITFTTSGGKDMVFWQDGDELKQQVDGKTNTLSKNLRFIAFTMPRSDDPTILSVSMTMEKATYQGGSKALELTIQKVRVMN
jgi:prepilin-type N-terminal cleavage/methylation domain-containing protein